MDSGVLPARTLTLFLSLFLLLLAFFLVLTALSAQEERRASAVLASLDATFRPGSVFTPPPAVVALSGSVPSAQRLFEESVRDAVETAFPAARITVIRPGQELEALFRPDQLFSEGNADIRPPLIAFLDRMAALMGSAPTGLVYEVELILGTDYDSMEIGSGSGATSAAQHDTAGLAVARAGAFARQMLARGAPPRALAVGLEPHTARGQDAAARLLFRLIEPPTDTPRPDAPPGGPIRMDDGDGGGTRRAPQQDRDGHG